MPEMLLLSVALLTIDAEAQLRLVWVKSGCVDNELSVCDVPAGVRTYLPHMWNGLKPEEIAASAIKSEAEQMEIWEGQVWKTFQISST